MRVLTVIPTVHNYEDAYPRAAQLLKDNRAWEMVIDSTRDVISESAERGFVKIREVSSEIRVFLEGVNEINITEFKLLPELSIPGYAFSALEDSTLHHKTYEALDKCATLFQEGANRTIIDSALGEYRALQQEREAHFISVIDGELKEGEHGILYIGVGHDILSSLPDDISVSFVSPEAKKLFDLTHDGRDLDTIEVAWEFLLSEGGLRGKERL